MADVMISIGEALDIIKANLPEPRTGAKPLAAAIGCHLAADVRAPEPSPRYTNSAMDGYAVRWEDVQGATAERPVRLRVIGESRAGLPLDGLGAPGRAARISTGAMLPPGFDTVVRVEDTEEDNGDVLVLAVRRAGQDVRRAGEEFAAGDVILRRGQRISAPEAALLTAVGVAAIDVYRPCRVALLVTGSELVGAGEKIAPHQIRDSNMIMLDAAVRECGGRVAVRRRLADDEAATVAAIAEAAREADLVLCSGGVSVGRHDHVKEAALANGFDRLFWRISQKPGKPLFLARRDNVLLFGLPGNPVSAFMCFTHYVRPVIAAMSGRPFGWPVVTGEAACEIVNRGGRANMVRVRLAWRPNGGYRITHADKQGSHMLTSLSGADGYIILEPGRRLAPGERCDVYRYQFVQEPL